MSGRNLLAADKRVHAESGDCVGCEILDSAAYFKGRYGQLYKLQAQREKSERGSP